MEEWLKRGYQGKMDYLNNHFDKRLDPRLLVPGAKSVISLGYNYFPSKDLAADGTMKIAKYAYGEDYHFVVKDKLTMLVERLKDWGHTVKVFREPGGTPIGEEVRKILLHTKEEMTLHCEMLLYMASRAQLVEEKILPYRANAQNG